MRLLLAPLLIGTICLLAFAPWVLLLHWASGISLTTLLAASLLLTIPYLWLTFRALRRGPKWLGFLSMQFFGVGSLGFTLMFPALLLSLWVPPAWLALLMATAWICLTAYAIHRAHRVRDVFAEISDPRIEKPFRAVQISDVHIGSRQPGFLDRIVEQVNRHTPDVVLITGDLVDLDVVEHGDLLALEKLTVPTLFCLGNHERYIDLDRTLEAIAHRGVHVLRDERLVIDGVQYIGIDDDDRADHLPAVLERLAPDPDRFSIVLYHRPDGWRHVVDFGLPLMLSGHTHNGQIWPFSLLVKLQYPEVAGWYERDGSRLHVSSGTGTWGPTMRFGTASEMLIIDFCA